MGWGGAFTDEPLSELLNAILHETSVTHLDRYARHQLRRHYLLSYLKKSTTFAPPSISRT
jgi:hypothetical protein